VGVRRPWLGRSFIIVRDQRERGGGGRKEEGEKWQSHDK
jgi:hypothetical protein